MNSTFMSVSGQRLELGREAENHGQFAATIGTNAPGQCLPISTFEKLNQLGEGSEFLPAKSPRSFTQG